MSVKEILPKAIIFGLKGYSITNEERKIFKNINPLGFILFERNCKKFIFEYDIEYRLKNTEMQI